MKYPTGRKLFAGRCRSNRGELHEPAFQMTVRRRADKTTPPTKQVAKGSLILLGAHGGRGKRSQSRAYFTPKSQPTPAGSARETSR
jgi:hypothetical protein